MARAELILAVCAPVAERGIRHLAVTVPCFHCEALLGMNEDAYAAWKHVTGVHRAICASCFLAYYVGSDEILRQYFRNEWSCLDTQGGLYATED